MASLKSDLVILMELERKYFAEETLNIPQNMPFLISKWFKLESVHPFLVLTFCFVETV